MKNRFHKSQKQFLIKTFKSDLSTINKSIDSKLDKLLDQYTHITENNFEDLYKDMCSLYTEFYSKLNSNDKNNYKISSILIKNDELLSKYYELKSNLLIENLINEYLKDIANNELTTLAFIESQISSIDFQVSILVKNIGFKKTLYKTHEFCNHILEDFDINIENKIIDLYNLFYEEFSKEVFENEVILNEINKLSDNKLSNKIPTEYKNKRLTYNELASIALQNNFFHCRNNGDHQIFKNNGTNKIVVIPYKANCTAAYGTQSSILNSIFN